MKTALTAYLVLALLSACKTTERLPEHDVRPGLENPAGPRHSEPGNLPPPAKRDAPFAAGNYPPAAPVNPTRRTARAYKQQVAAWKEVEKARAQVRAQPKKLGKGAVYAPAATEVVASYKPKAPVMAADTGAWVAVSEKGTAVAGQGNQVPTENNTGIPWWPFAVGGFGLLALLIALRKPSFLS